MICKELLSIGLDIVSRVTRIKPEKIMSCSTTHDITQARHLYCYVMARFGFNAKDIGGFLGRDRTTVIYAIDKIAGQIPYYDDVRKAVSNIENYIYQYEVKLG